MCGEIPVYGDESAGEIVNDVEDAAQAASDAFAAAVEAAGYVDIGAGVVLPGPNGVGIAITVGCQIQISDPLDPSCYLGAGLGEPIGPPSVSVSVAPGQTITNGPYCSAQGTVPLPGAPVGIGGQVGIGGLDEDGKGAPFVEVGVSFPPAPGGSATCGVVVPVRDILP